MGLRENLPILFAAERLAATATSAVATDWVGGALARGHRLDRGAGEIPRRVLIITLVTVVATALLTSRAAYRGRLAVD